MDVSEGRHGFAAEMRASVDRCGTGSWLAKPQTGGTFEAKSWAWGLGQATPLADQPMSTDRRTTTAERSRAAVPPIAAHRLRA